MKNVAYFLSTFPTVSTTFIQREVRALETQGIRLQFVSTKAPSKGDYHPQDEDLKQRTFYLSQASIFSYVFSFISWFCKHPVTTIKTIILALSLKDDFKYQRIHNLIHVLVAIRLAHWVHTQKITHLHVHFAFGAAAIAIFHRSLSKIPYSLSIHGSDVLLKRPLTEEKLKNASVIFSNCHYHVNNLTSKYPSLSRDKFRLLRISLDLDHAPWLSAPWNTELPKKLKVLHVGRLVEVKAQHILINACHQLIRAMHLVELHIVGDGPLFEALDQQIKRLGITEQIQLLGRKYEHEILKEFSWCDVVVLSSLSEGTPMTFIEAMAMGRPIIGPNITAIPEMIESGINGFVYLKEDTQDLAAQLLKLYQEPQLIAQMGAAARKKAEAEHNIRKNIAVLAETLTK